MASYELALEYQKWVDNGVADALSQVPVEHDHMTVRLLLEEVAIGAMDSGKAEANKALLCEHVHLVDKARVQVAKLALMHVVDWHEAQEKDGALAACIKWLKAHKDTPKEKQDAQLKEYIGNLVDTEEGRALFHMHHSLTLHKELLYLSTRGYWHSWYL